MVISADAVVVQRFFIRLMRKCIRKTAMNWDDTRVFLALCREHTLRGAARALHIDQATVGRRLASLEAALGSTLFLRTSSGYLLTPAGEAAFELAEKMERSALSCCGGPAGWTTDCPARCGCPPPTPGRRLRATRPGPPAP